jgi:hypothetical protein
MNKVLQLLPTFPQMNGLGAVLTAAAGLAVLGAFAGGQRWREADLAAGCGLASAVFAVLCGPMALPATPTAVILAGMSLWAAWSLLRKLETVLPSATGTMTILLAPPLILAAAMVPSQWDELSLWLWNVDGMIARDGLPEHASASFGVAILPFLATRLAGGMVEQAGAIANILLLGSLGLALARLMADTQGLRRLGPGLCAAGLALATILSPGFAAKAALTAQPTTTSTVFLALGGILAWSMAEAAIAGKSQDAMALAWKTALVLVGLALVDDANLVLLMLLAGALATILLRNRKTGWRNWMPPFLLAVLPPLLMAVAWRVYAARHLPGLEATIPPPDGWPHDLLPRTWGSLPVEMASQILYFALLSAVTLAGAGALLRGQSGPARLAALAALVALGHQAVLLPGLAVGDAGARAAYWNDSRQAGALIICGLVGWVAASRHVVIPAWIGRLTFAVVLLIPILLARIIRFDLEAPAPFLRTVGMESAAILAAGDRLSVVDVADNGYAWLALRWPIRTSGAQVTGLFGMSEADSATLSQRLEPSSHAIVRHANDAVREAFGLPLPPGQTALLQRGRDGWIILKRWTESPPPGLT